uniref:Uncharacterized protein n=1 Tax=viral metagenome TaxID=1070528 RepID=A0A6C0KQW9_9ZZZZ
MKNRNSNSKMRKNNRKLFSNNKLLNNKLLNNKVILFIVTALALFSLYIHITKSNFSAVLLFFLTAALVYTFTKNMILVLGASFIVTTIASMSKNLFGLKEGFKEGKDEEGKDGVEEDDKEGKSTGKETKKATEESTTAEDAIVNKMKTNDTDTDADTEGDTVTKTTKNKKQSNFDNQKLAPALFNTPSKKSVEQQLGKATEVEQAYDNLEKIMGSEKINSISTDTKDLIKQQNELIKQLKTMTPALNSAMSSLGNLDLNKLTGMFNSATKNLSDIQE